MSEGAAAAIEGGGDVGGGDVGAGAGGSADTSSAGITTGSETAPASESWLQNLGADYKDNPSITKFTSADELARGYINAQSAIGSEKISAPREDWTKENWDEFHTKLGRPADAADYNLGDFVAPESGWSEDHQNALIDVLHQGGANSELVEAVLKTQAEFQMEGSELKAAQAEQITATAVQNLKNELGTSFNAQIAGAHAAWRQFAGNDFEEIANTELADGTTLGNNPQIIKIFAAINDGMAEHGLVGGDTSSRTTLSPVEAGREILRVKGDEKFRKAWMDKAHPEHDMAVQRIDDLTRMEMSGGE